MSEDYKDILSQSWDNIQEAHVLPVGSYLIKGRNASFQPSKEEGKSPAVMFVYAAKEPMDDVKTEELEALGTDYDITENRIFKRFYIETGADWDAVRKHLEKHGVSTKGRSIEDSLKAFKGTEVIAYLEQRNFTTKAGEAATSNEPTTFAPVE